MTTPARLTWWGDLGHRIVFPIIVACGVTTVTLAIFGVIP